MNSFKQVGLTACVALMTGCAIRGTILMGIATMPRVAQATAIQPTATALLDTKTKESAQSEDQAQQWYDQAWELIEAGKPQQALALFDRVLKQYPNHAPTHAGRGQALYDLKRYPEAIAALQQAVQLDAKLVSAWVNLGNALDDGGQPQAALKAYEQAIQLNPKSGNAWYNKGVTLGRLKQYKEAIAAYDRAIALNPKFEAASYNRGVALVRLERYRDAIAAFDQTLQINPKNKDAQQNRDSLIRKVGQVPRTNAV